jgi:hypothetical protein
VFFSWETRAPPACQKAGHRPDATHITFLE